MRELQAFDVQNSRLPHVQDKKYFLVGQLLQWSIMHGGPGLPVLTPPVYNAVTGQSVTIDDVKYVQDADVHHRLHQVCCYGNCYAVDLSVLTFFVSHDS